MFDKLAKAGLKLKPSKCEFFRSKITYLGHIVSVAGIETDPRKIKAVKDWTVLKTVTDIRSFLGFINHYRRFIQGYAKVAQPLNTLISGDNANRKKALVNWTPECQLAFDQLKDLCTSTPILAYADYKKPFQLQTDASDLGLGAVLCQVNDDKHQRVIAYASCSLSNTERNYPAHKLEFLALKWAVMNRFHEYLYGGQFDVYTDNNPLTYVLTSAKLDATGQRWVASLANYDFRIFYKSGKSNVGADVLSCIPRASTILIDAPAVKAIMSAILYTDHTDHNYNPSNIVCKSTLVVVHKKSRDDWKVEQENNPIIGPAIEAISSKKCSEDALSDKSRWLLCNRGRLLFRCGLLYRKVFDGQLQENKFQFVLPQTYWKQALEACNDNMGHLGIERTTSLLRDHFYWPSILEDIEKHLKSCPRCLRFKTQPEKAELNPIIATKLVHIDCLTIEPPSNSRSNKDVNILIITDHFTRYAQVHITSSRKAPIAAKTLWDHFFVHYGFLEKILSDQGQNFESLLISELCELTQIKKLRTMPYRPEGNGSCKRFNRTLICMLGTLPDDFKSKWTQYISTLVYAYNCTHSNATGFSPYYLLYGRHPLLPIDIKFGVFVLKLSGVITYTNYKYVQELKKRLENAFQKANAFCEKEAMRSKQHFDRTARCSKLLPGDLVLVKKKGFTSKHKIADKWETEPYEIVSQRSDGLPVYTVMEND